MGHYKNEAVSAQAEIDEIIAWYRYHEKHLPIHDFATLLSSPTLMDMSLRDWSQGRPWVPSAKPASSHVALQNRDHIRAERRARRQIDWGAIIGWPLIAVSLIVSFYILITEVF